MIETISGSPSFRAEYDWHLAQEKEKESETMVAARVFANSTIRSECGCCFDDVPVEATVHCQAGHVFCGMCVQRYAEEQLFGNGKTQMRCMHMSGTCKEIFAESQLLRAIPPKTMKKYDEARAKEALALASVSDLVSCPFCMTVVSLPPDNSVLDCPNVDCGRSSCRHCKEESHIPLRCDEVEKEVEKDLRLSIEERMTEARLRTCPNTKCGKKFYKTEGCNKDEVRMRHNHVLYMSEAAEQKEPLHALLPDTALHSRILWKVCFMVAWSGG